MKQADAVPYHIAVVGVGVGGAYRLTQEVRETLQRCEIVFVANESRRSIDFVQELSANVVDLSLETEADGDRLALYQRMASRVVAAAAQGSTVCFAVYGHPGMFCYPTTLIRRAATVLGLIVQILPGISFLDTVLLDLGVDPGLDGLQVYEATDMVVRQRPLQADVACLVTQVSMVGDRSSRSGRPNERNLNVFRDYLLQFYPPAHECTAVISATHPLLSSMARTFPLRDLPHEIKALPALSTLYLPPVTNRHAVGDPFGGP